MDIDSPELIYKDRIQNVVNYISDHLFEKIDLNLLASIACFSPYHFHRIFTAFTGETPRSFTERIKLESAANRICDMPNKSITEIAEEVGFDSNATFSRLFKKQYRLSPTDFRKERDKNRYFIRHSQHVSSIKVTEADFLSIEIKKQPSVTIAYIQTMRGYASGITKTWQKLKNLAENQHLINERTIYIGIPFDNPGITPNEKCRYRACISIPENTLLQHGEIKSSIIKEGEYVIFHYSGTAATLLSAFDYIYGEWLPANRMIPAEQPQLELYGYDFLETLGAGEYLEYSDIQIALPVMSF